LRLAYKPYPAGEPSAPFGEKYVWWPVVPVRIVDQRVQVKTKSFHAVVDSGSSACFFHAEFLKPFKVKLTDGIKASLGGIGRGTAIPVYYHDVYILVGLDWKIGIRAGFSEELSVAGILGRTGFFDAFRVTFDHSDHPPVLEIDKIEPKAVH
jgi:hypothetical protein